MEIAELLRLPERGARGVQNILRMARHGDWRTRALCVSAAGQIARRETRLRSLIGRVAHRSPIWRRLIPAAGDHGRYVRDEIANALVDRAWPVRVAAALALGDCRSPASVDALRPLLRAPYRVERIAAAAAIVRCGGDVPGSQDPGIHHAGSLLEGAVPVPARIGDTTNTIEFLATLIADHPHVLPAWLTTSGADRPAGDTPLAWATYVAGPVPDATYQGTDAEIQRYDAEGETDYLLAKPFSAINRAQNVRLLHSFFVAAEQLRVPSGGRILDIGGGSGWVSELLATFGFRVFTLDLSTALLSLARRRLARSGATPRLMAGDMTCLPVATHSMDAVIVMDALHHVPDVPAVFAEAFRVLADGGQFVLAEPGDGHAESERSRGEMLEHGVEEREIHVFEMIDYARAAGFDRIRVVPHYVPGISMTPEQVRAAMASSADDWMMFQDDKRGYFAQYVMQSMFGRPILMFQRGARPVDSRTPRILKADVAPQLTRDHARVSGTVTVRNTGDTIWLGGGDETGQVQLGFRLLGADRRPIDPEFARFPLPATISPGSEIRVVISADLPEPDARYVLKIDLVNEGICWFEDAGSRPIYVEV